MTSYLYVGFGDFVPGVPARDLSAEEWAAVPEEWRGLAESLYQAVEGKEEPRTNAFVRGQEETEIGHGREGAGAVDDDPPGVADDRARHRAVPRHRRGEAEG